MSTLERRLSNASPLRNTLRRTSLPRHTSPNPTLKKHHAAEYSKDRSRVLKTLMSLCQSALASMFACETHVQREVDSWEFGVLKSVRQSGLFDERLFERGTISRARATARAGAPPRLLLRKTRVPRGVCQISESQWRNERERERPLILEREFCRNRHFSCRRTSRFASLDGRSASQAMA